MEPSGVLRRAGAGDAPNVALGPLKWNVAKIRKGVDDRLAAIDDRRRAAAAERSSAHALLRGRLDARHQRERSTLKLASQPSQPKKIAALQASALNLRRHGRVEDARRKEKEATELGDVHWRTTAGKAFERSVLADVAKLEASFSMSDGADDAVLDRERLGILRKLDAAVASTRRENGRSHNILTWKGYHHAANGDLVKLQGVVERLGIEVVLLQKDPDTQWNALFFGAWADKVQIVHFLLDRGAAKLDHADPEGRTVLHVAAAFGSREVCAALIERGADMDCRNKKGETTLQIAQRMRRPQALLDYLGKFIRVPKARAEEFEKERLLEVKYLALTQKFDATAFVIAPHADDDDAHHLGLPTKADLNLLATGGVFTGVTSTSGSFTSTSGSFPDVSTTASSATAPRDAFSDWAGLDVSSEDVRYALRKLFFKEEAFGPLHPGLLANLKALASAFIRCGEHRGARVARERIVVLADELDESAAAMVEAWNDVGVACHACAASDDATEAFEYALELAEEAAAAEAAEAVAVDNVIAVDTKSDLASVPLRNLALHLLSAGDLRRAVPLLRRVLEATALKHNPAGFVPVDETFGAGDDLQVDEAAMAQSDPSRIESLVVVDPLVALGYALLLDCDFDGSTRVYARALRIVRTHLGPDAAENVRLLEFLALVAFSSGHFDRAEELFRRTLKVLDGLGRSNIDVDVKRTIANMAQARVRRGKRGPTKPDKRLFAMPIPALFSQTASLSSQTAGSAHGEGLVASASLSALRGAAPR